MKKRIKYLFIILLSVSVTGVVFVYLFGARSSYIKTTLDIDYFEYDSLSPYKQGVVVLKDGWRIPCESVLSGIIKKGSLIKKTGMSLDSCQYVLADKRVEMYLTYDYHINRVHEIMSYSDFIMDYNPYYSCCLVLDIPDEESIVGTLLAINEKGRYPLPVFTKPFVFNREYIPIGQSLSYMKKCHYYAYKSNLMKDVFLLYEKHTPYSSNMILYPRLLYCDCLRGLNIVESSSAGSLFEIDNLQLKNFQTGMLLWKDDIYLEAISKNSCPPVMTPEYRALVDSAIIDSNNLIANKL